MNKLEIALKKGYRVSKGGELINPNGVIISGSLSSNGYLKFKFSYNGIKQEMPVHRLQAFQKFGAELFNQGVVVRHLNSNKTDNSEDNIAIGSYSDNAMDRPLEQRRKISSIATRKITKYNHDSIFLIYSTVGYKKTRDQTGISKCALTHIVNKYKHFISMAVHR